MKIVKYIAYIPHSWIFVEMDNGEYYKIPFKENAEIDRYRVADTFFRFAQWYTGGAYITDEAKSQAEHFLKVCKLSKFAI